MSFFDHPYYAMTKSHLCRIGSWPEQSKYVRIIWPWTMLAIAMTLAIPGLIRMHDARTDANTIINSTILLLIGFTIFCNLFSFNRQFEKTKLSLKYIEEHWEMVKNTPAVIVLDEYAERGRIFTVVYSTCICIALTLHFGLCISRIILDFVDPLNETRPKMYIIEAEYGVDADQYYWFILAHTYIVIAIAISILLGLETMYILWVVHACALFEVVGYV